MLALRLDLPSLGERTLFLRELDGRAELLAEPDAPRAAETLLAALLVEADGTPVAMPGLLATWFDRALAALFGREFGGRIECRSRCRACGEAYEFGFALADMLAAQDAAARLAGLTPDADGYWLLASGARMRPPTLGDLARQPDPAALLADLADGPVDAVIAEATLEACAPLLSGEAEARCPECDAAQTLDFDIDRYLIESLAGERPLLVRETHLIASRYGWSHDAIMVLPRRDRRAYAQLIIGERSLTQQRRAL
jgi:hypothetical protein